MAFSPQSQNWNLNMTTFWLSFSWKEGAKQIEKPLTTPTALTVSGMSKCSQSFQWLFLSIWEIKANLKLRKPSTSHWMVEECQYYLINHYPLKIMLIQWILHYYPNDNSCYGKNKQQYTHKHGQEKDHNQFKSNGWKFIYNTRFSSAGNYYVNSSRTNVMRNSISRLGPNLWNSLNNTTREFPRKSFKTKVHNMLLSFLASEDIYIESPSIIQKLISKSLHNDS